MAYAKDLVRNYLGYGGPDHLGRTLDQALAWNDAARESTHDYIQWWFPLTEPSAFNPHAPVASRADFDELKNDEPVKAGVELAMLRMLAFYGLYQDSSGAVLKSTAWEERSPNWVAAPNHNDLRITRMLKSLCLLGHRAHAEAILAALERIIQRERVAGGDAPLRFWRAALR